MIFRLNNGHGEAYYQIGVEDNGFVTGLSDEDITNTLSVLFFMSKNLHATIKITKVRIGL